MLRSDLTLESRRNPMIKKSHLLVLTLLLGACKANTTPAPAPVLQPVRTHVICLPAKDNPETSDILRYYSHLSALSAQDAAGEYNAVNASFSKNPDNVLRIKLAMLLSLPNTSFHNTAAARDLLMAWPDQDATELHDLARLLGSLFSQQQQADDAISELNKSLASEKMHSKSLQGKIDAIKAYETNRKDQP